MYRAIKRGPPPPDSLESAAAVKKVVLSPTGPRYGRPSHRFGPPTALFSEPLAILKYDLGHLQSFTPNPTTLDHTLNIIASATDFLPDEGKREASSKTVLENLLVGRNEWQQPISDKATEPCGVWLEGFSGYLIVTLKDDLGLGGDPFLQGLAVYGRVTTQDEVAF